MPYSFAPLHSKRQILFGFFVSYCSSNHQIGFCNAISRLILPLVLHSSEKDNLSKGNHLAEDEPDVDHLDVRGGGQALHFADEDSRHHQHGRQVHTQGRLKEEGLEEGGGKGDCSQKQGWEISRHQLARQFPPHRYKHL